MPFLLIPKTLNSIEKRQMNDNIFLDTNILVYSYSNNELEKQRIARKIIENNNTFISTQVLQELTNTVTRKLRFSYTDASNAIRECCKTTMYILIQKTLFYKLA